MKKIVSIVLLFFYLSTYDLVSQSFKLKLTEHGANLESVAFAPNGQQFASGDWNGTIHLYTLDSSKNFIFSHSLPGHLGAITSLVYSRNGKYLVSNSKDYTVRVWNLDTLENSKSFNLHTQPVTAAFLDPSSKYLITGCEDGSVKTTSISNIKKTREFKAGGPVTKVIVTKNFKFYYVAIKGGTIKKFEAYGKNKEVQTYTGHTDDVNALELTPDERLLASGSNDKSIIIWDALTSKVFKTLSGFEWKVTSINISSDGKHIIGGCNDGFTKLFEIETGKLVSDFKEIGMNVRDVTMSIDGTLIAVATHTDGEKFGAIIYDSGITSSPPGLRTKAKTGAKATTTRRTVKPKR